MPFCLTCRTFDLCACTVYVTCELMDLPFQSSKPWLKVRIKQITTCTVFETSHVSRPKAALLWARCEMGAVPRLKDDWQVFGWPNFCHAWIGKVWWVIARRYDECMNCIKYFGTCYFEHIRHQRFRCFDTGGACRGAHRKPFLHRKHESLFFITRKLHCGVLPSHCCRPSSGSRRTCARLSIADKNHCVCITVVHITSIREMMNLKWNGWEASYSVRFVH